MHLRLGLKPRFLLATLGLAGVLIGGFTLAIHQFLEALEQGLSIPAFKREFVAYVEAWAADPSRLPPTRMGYQSYLALQGDGAAVPAELRRLAPGVYEEVVVAGNAYAVGRHEDAGASLFLLRDARFDPVERLEGELTEITLYALCAAALLAFGMTLWLVRLVVRPVETLARLVADIEPGMPRRALQDADDDPALGRIAAAFDATLDRYDELLEQERAFARDASHELRTPLAVILTGVELIEPALGADVRLATRLGRVRAAAEQMQALTEGLLFLAHPDPAPAGPPCAVAEIVADAVRIQRLANAPSLDLQVSGDDGGRLFAPRGLLLCVVNNLLRNAIEHGGDGRIDIVLAKHSLSIVDQGPGIDPAIRASLFEAHVRGPDSSGQGLGLNIVRRICDGLGWTIALDAAGGQGTRVVLRFAGTAPVD